MSWTDLFNNPGYKNWLRVGIALLVTRDGLKNVTLQAANKLQAELKAKLGDSVENCTCNPKRGQECKDCGPWRRELETYYDGDVERIGWTNCTPSKWSKEPWEVAKVFMPKDPTAAADNTGPEKSDPAALLNFLVHCTYCKEYVKKSKVEPAKKVIEVRNKAMHFKDLTFDRQTFNEYMDKMVRLLKQVKDPLSQTLAADETAEEAAVEILKIKKGEFHIGPEKTCLDAEIRVFREFMAEQDKLLQLHKEQLEDHGTRLDTLEKSIPPVEEIRQTLDLISDIVNNNADLQQLKDQAMALSTIAQQLQDRLDKVEGAVSQLEETVAEHGEQISEVQGTVAEHGEQISEVQGTVAEHGEQISDVQERLDQLEVPSRSTTVSPDEQTSAFTRALTTNYSNTLNTLKPLPWNPRFCLELDKVFTHLELGGYEGMTFQSLDEVYDHQPESDLPNRFNVLVVGDAGSGKSTLLSKTALDWSRKKGRLADMNKIVLLIRLRKVKPGKSIVQIVLDQCVTKSAEGISLSKIETCLRENESNLVFLLDGYDELVPGAKEPEQAVPELLAKKWYPACTIIVTARPSSGIEHHMVDNCKVNVVGFSSALVDNYVPLYFQSVEKPGLADSLVKALHSKANIVARGLIQTPMFLVLICALWELQDNPKMDQFPVTMSGLYRKLLSCVIKKYCVREGLPIPNDDEIPPVVSAALLQLGKLALESLLIGESMVDLGENNANHDIDVVKDIGIVSKEVSASKVDPTEQLNFRHKSMQEFLAGRYVADRVNTHVSKVLQCWNLLQFICCCGSGGYLHSLFPLDTVLKQENLVQFICGCGGKVTSKLLTCLKELAGGIQLENKEKNALKHLCLMSLYEGQNSQHVPILSTVLSSLDLKINIPSREGAALKYYLDHAGEVPEGRSLNLQVVENSKGDAVEYLSRLVGKPKPDRQNPNLSRNIANEDTAAIQQPVQPVPSLKVLNLSYNKIGDVCLGSLLALVLYHLPCLEDLDLSHNNIGDGGLEPFANIQQPVSSLRVLKLSHNKIGAVCLGSLVAVLHRVSSLLDLDLSHNNIRDAEVASLAATLHRTPTLKYVRLGGNPITAVGLQRFAETIQKMPALERLYLDPQETVHLDDTDAICTMLARMPVLRYLVLKNISLQAAGFQAVVTAVEKYPTLARLCYSRECVPQEVDTSSSKSIVLS